MAISSSDASLVPRKSLLEEERKDDKKKGKVTTIKRPPRRLISRPGSERSWINRKEGIFLEHPLGDRGCCLVST